MPPGGLSPKTDRLGAFRIGAATMLSLLDYRPNDTRSPHDRFSNSLGTRTMAQSYTDRQWEKWGQRNPYQGVLGVEDSTINQAENLRAFRRSGEEHVAERLANVARIFSGWAPRGVALDFGCGVGRLA